MAGTKITTKLTAGIRLTTAAEEPITVTKTGSIVTTGGYAIQVDGYAGTLTNSGLLSAEQGAVYFFAGGLVNNLGAIKGTGGAGITGIGIVIEGGSGLVDNGSAAATGDSITGTQYGVELLGPNEVNVYDSESVVNFGTILSSAQKAGEGVYISIGEYDTGGVTNGSAQVTTALIKGATGVKTSYGAPGTIHNFGSIIGVGATDEGVELGGGGTLTNGSAGDTRALISGVSQGIGGLTGSGTTTTITNYGKIVATGTSAFGIDLLGNIDITNSGTIAATGAKGIGLDLIDTAHVFNAGTIAGTEDAIAASALYLTVVPGAVFTGAVTELLGTGQLYLAAGAGAGTLNMGSSFTSIDDLGSSFDGINFAAGATWTLEGSVTEFSDPYNGSNNAGGQTISGFAAADTIVIEGFAATSHNFAPGTGLILNGDETLGFTGSYATNAFNVTTEGSNTTIALATPAQAAAPVFGPATTIGTLGVPGEQDWLAVSLAANQAYEFTVTGLSELAEISVGTAAAEDAGTVAVQSGGASGADFPSATQNVWFTPLHAGIYYLDVADPYSVGTTYAVSAAAVPNDYTDNTSTTGTITAGGPLSTGTLGEIGEHDWLAVSLTANQAYEFTTTGLSEFGKVDINPGGYQIYEGSSAMGAQTAFLGGSSPATQTTWFTPGQSGTYYVDVSDSGSDSTTYAVSAVTAPNDYTDNASTLGRLAVDGAATTGTLGLPGEIDWIAVSLAANQAYEFVTTGLSEFAEIDVGTSLALDQGYGAEQSDASLLGIGSMAATQDTWFTPETAGIYYVQVSDALTVGGTYAVTALSEPNDHTDNATTNATLTVGGAATTGTLGLPGEHDWLAVSLTANQAYAVNVTGLTDFAALEIGAASTLEEGVFSQNTDSLLNNGATAQSNADWFTPETSGLYYLDISDQGGTGDAYAASISAVPNDYTDNTTTRGTVVVGGVASIGTIGVEDEHDWLAISLTANQAYLVTVTGLTTDAAVQVGTADALAGDTGSDFGSGAQVGDGATPATAQTWFTPDTSGTYYIDVSDGATVGGTYAVSAVTEPNDYTDNTTTKGTVGFGQALTAGTLVIPSGTVYAALQIDAGARVTVQSGGSITSPDIAGGTLDLGPGSVLTGDIRFSGTGGRLILDDAASLPNTITGFAPGDSIKLANVPFVAGDYATVAAPGVLTVDAGGTEYDFNIAGAYVGESAFSVTGDLLITEAATCFAAGTGIATPEGRRLVEDLRAGDWVETLHAGAQLVRWIGTRAYDGRFIRGNHLALPICIGRDALGAGVPSRNLVVSPGHGIYVGGVLVPAWRLVNGASITQAEEVDSVTYFHIELETHEVLLAENCPAESFLDGAFRAQFQNATAYPEPARPMAGLERVESGPVLEAIRRRIAGRARLAPVGVMRGFVEQAGPGRVSGWARDGKTPVWLDVLSGGRRVARVLANQYRPDLRAAGLGSGNHGFDVALPEWVRGDIEVRCASGGERLAEVAVKAA